MENKMRELLGTLPELEIMTIFFQKTNNLIQYGKGVDRDGCPVEAKTHAINTIISYSAGEGDASQLLYKINDRYLAQYLHSKSIRMTTPATRVTLVQDVLTYWGMGAPQLTSPYGCASPCLGQGLFGNQANFIQSPQTYLTPALPPPFTFQAAPTSYQNQNAFANSNIPSPFNQRPQSIPFKIPPLNFQSTPFQSQTIFGTPAFPFQSAPLQCQSAFGGPAFQALTQPVQLQNQAPFPVPAPLLSNPVAPVQNPSGLSLVKPSEAATQDNQMGTEFTTWFYERLNTLTDFTPAHFWSDCCFKLESNLSSQACIDEVFNDGEACCSKIKDFVAIKQLYFAPNTPSGIQTNQSSFGSVEIVVRGFLHNKGLGSPAPAVAMFEQVFKLIIDPIDKKYKVKSTVLRIKDGSPVAPAIQNGSV